MARVTVNSVFLTAEKGAHLLGGMLLLVGVARFLGEGGLADYVFVIGLTAFFVPLLDSGLNNRIIKAAASSPAEGRTLCSEAISFKLALALPALAVMVAAAWAFGTGRDVTLAALLVGVSTVLMSMGDGLNAVFKGLQRSGYCAVLMIGLNVVLLASGIGGMIAGWDIVGVGTCYLVCRAGYLAAGFVFIRRVAGEFGSIPRPGINRRRIVEGLKHLPAVYFLVNLLNLNYLTAYYQTGGGAEAGYLAVGYRLAAALLILIGASFEAVLPALSTLRFRSTGVQETHCPVLSGALRALPLRFRPPRTGCLHRGYPGFWARRIFRRCSTQVFWYGAYRPLCCAVWRIPSFWLPTSRVRRQYG